SLRPAQKPQGSQGDAHESFVLMPSCSLFRRPIHFNFFPMAANNHRVVIETEAHNLAHRLADMFSRDSERIERERAESLAKITTLQQQVIDLSARLTEAQGRAATLTGVEAALARTEGQLDTVRTQLDGTQKELEDTREVNADLKTKLDDTKSLLYRCIQ
ncbi:hypothetical protein MPER_01139, partial [Moniliophthora perniciosa FA553]